MSGDLTGERGVTIPGANGEEAVLWRCRECGKWSHAKRDPIAHKRWHHVEGEPRWCGWFVWCGPMDRWLARHDDPRPRTLPHIGQPVSKAERELALHPPPPDDGDLIF